MEQYESYKDSGVEWIGKVPKHWGIGRMKYTGKFENGLIYSANDISDDSGKLVLRSSNIQSCRLNFTDCIYVHHAPDELMVQKGDIIICSRNGSVNLIGKCAYIENDMNATFGAFMLRYRPQIHSKFAFYLFQSVVSYYKGLFSTTTINQLTKEAIGQMKIPLVPDYEQQALAAYLDKRCRELDKAIATQQKRIALLQELKQSIITHAVTRGIHPDVPLKESGVEWIGKVPKHWEVRRMKFLTREYKAGPFGSALITSKLSDNGSVLVYTPEHIANQSTQLVNNLYLPETRVKEMSQFFVKVNDVIFSIVGTLGRAMLITEDMPKGIINQRLAKFSVNEKDILIEYLLWLFAHSIFYEHYMQLYQRGSVIVNLTKEIIGNMPVPLPPINEQYQIVAYLKECTIKLDTYIAHAEQRIALLQELKQSIITEAITGKIKVC